MTTAEQSDQLVSRLISRHGGNTPEQAIERFVSKQLRDAGQNRLPVDVEAMSSLLGIRQRIREYPFAGRIYVDESGQLIMDLSSSDSPPRRRFTCAHEILHLAFPGFKQEVRYRLDRSTGGYEMERSVEEYLCDYGAALMLMPAELVAAKYQIQDGLAAVTRLKRDAQVSLEAAANRLVKLADVPCALVVLEVGHKPADMKRLRRGEPVDPELRVRYGVVNGMPFIPRFKSADRGSPFERALDGAGIVSGLGSLPGAGASRVYIEAMSVAGGDEVGSPSRVLAVARSG